MFTLDTERKAIEGYAALNSVDHFEYDGLKGFVAFDLYCTDHPEFLVELIVAYLDKLNQIDADWPSLPEVA